MLPPGNYFLKGNDGEEGVQTGGSPIDSWIDLSIIIDQLWVLINKTVIN